MAVLELTGRQRKYLRGLAHSLDARVQVGQSGVTDGVIGAVDNALASQELIKVRLHEPADKKADANTLAERTGSALCGLVGHTVVLYRPDLEEPRIKIPE